MNRCSKSACSACLAIAALTGCATARHSASAIPTFHGRKQTMYALQYADIVIGSGAVAEPGMSYTVHYTGWLASGTRFESSHDEEKPITFQQGKRMVIPGWDNGFRRMRVGGKRRLFIPYQLA